MGPTPTSHSETLQNVPEWSSRAQDATSGEWRWVKSPVKTVALSMCVWGGFQLNVPLCPLSARHCLLSGACAPPAPRKHRWGVTGSALAPRRPLLTFLRGQEQSFSFQTVPQGNGSGPEHLWPAVSTVSTKLFSSRLSQESTQRVPQFGPPSTADLHGNPTPRFLEPMDWPLLRSWGAES